MIHINLKRFIAGFQHSETPASLILVLAGISVFLFSTLAPGFISGTSSYWLAENQDITQYIAGFNAYFSSSWRWPLLFFDNFNYPDGTRAIFVDIIPIYSVVLKLFIPSDFFPFNPFGVWIALCFLLQGVAAWWIARELKEKSWVVLIFLVVSFTLFPALMARVGHVSLMSHWVLLFSFALYIKSHNENSLQFKSFAALLFGCFYINIYLFVMSYAIYIATVVHLKGEYGVKKSIKYIIIPFLLVLTSLFLTILPLQVADISREWGFGYYSMNLLSPISGGKIINIHGPEMPGQGEGYNYLGLGVLVLFLWGVYLNHKNDLRLFSKHKSLVILLCLFAVYALSNQVYFGQVRIAILSYPHILDGLTAQFRSSGRFFWPVGYAVVIFGVVVVLRSVKRPVSLLLICFATILQIVDLEDRVSILNKTSNRPTSQILDQYALDGSLHEDIRNIYFYPKFRCAKNSSPHATLLPLMRYVSERDIKLNTGYIARYQPACDDIQDEIAKADMSSSAFVFAAEDFGVLSEIITMFPPGFGIGCSPLGKLFLCLPKSQTLLPKNLYKKK